MATGLRHGAVCDEYIGKGYGLFVNGQQTTVHPQGKAAMATPAPGAKPAAFPLSGGRFPPRAVR